MDVVGEAKRRVRGRGLKVVLPEGEDERILAAARRLVDEGLACPVVLGEGEAVRARLFALGLAHDGIEVRSATSDPGLSGLAAALSAQRPKLTPSMAERLLRKPLYFGGMLV